MRQLSISPDLGSVLLACRTVLGAFGPASIDLNRIRGAEQIWGGRLPDELIATWAAVGQPPPAPTSAYADEDFSPEGCIASFRSWADLRLLRPDDEPVPLFGTSVRHEYVCLIEAAGGGLTVSTRMLSSVDPYVTEDDDVPFVRWLRERYEVRPAEVLAARRSPPLEIILVDTPPRRVKHPELGAGELLADLGAWLEVRFETGVQRVQRSNVVVQPAL